MAELNSFKMLEALDEYIDECNELGNAPGTQITKFTQLKRWLRVNDVEVDWKKVVLPKYRKVVQDKAPNKVELRKILMYAPTWLNAAIMVLATSGIRSGAHGFKAQTSRARKPVYNI